MSEDTLQHVIKVIDFCLDIEFNNHQMMNNFIAMNLGVEVNFDTDKYTILSNIVNKYRKRRTQIKQAGLESVEKLIYDCDMNNYEAMVGLENHIRKKFNTDISVSHTLTYHEILDQLLHKLVSEDEYA